MPDKQPAMGSWARRIDGTLVAEPSDERELIEVLHVLADRGARLNRDLRLSRARLDSVGAIHDRSMTVAVGAGVRLRDLEDRLQPEGLTLGPLSPAAMSLELGDFLEGPYAGLRSIPGGRLEPLCAGLTAVTSDGRRFETSKAPRSAAGPDLSALVLGGHGRLALVTSAIVRCVPYPERDVRMGLSFPSAQAFVASLQSAVADGLWPWRVHADGRSGRVLAEVRWASTVGSVERDRELLLRRAQETGGHASSEAQPEWPVRPERESTWDAVRAALERGEALQLFRLSLSTVVARGEVEGLALQGPSAWTSAAQPLLALDGRGSFGGAP